MVKRALSLASLALAMVATSSCILLYDEIGSDAAGGGASDAGGGGMGGLGGATDATDVTSTGAGGTGGTCELDRDGSVTERQMECQGAQVAASDNGVFVARDKDCNDAILASPNIASYDDAFILDAALAIPNPAGVGMVAVDDAAVLYAPQLGEILSCNPIDGECSSASATCENVGDPCASPWGGMARFESDSFVGITNEPNPYVFRFNEAGGFQNLTARDVTAEIGYDVAAIHLGDNDYSLAWTTTSSGLETGTVHRLSSRDGMPRRTKRGAPSGVAIDASETIYFRATTDDNDTRSELYQWRPDEEEAVILNPDVVGPILSLVAVHAETGVVYANGYIDDEGQQTMFRCACGECVAADIACDDIYGLDVRQADGAAFFTCGERVVRW